MNLKNEFTLILFFLIFFVILRYFIIQSQNKYKEENDEIVKIRINYLFLMSFLPYLFLNLILIFGCIRLFKNSNYVIGSLLLLVIIMVSIPILNGINHFLLELKRKVYYDRINNTLIVNDSNTKKVIKLSDNSSKLEHYLLKRTIRGGITSLDKMEISDKKNHIILSSILSFPFDFENKYKVDKIQTKKIFIWV
ncbi:hypothetical protein [Chishuiella sp.]|uniref:hypothetical protein n=1 Tax=Chishuiella sp. TaxID=1969467 RepID=UPI0028AA3E59|nr:hypothetical protein [Chishuiella sp.]